jgi:DNA polymerase-1
MINIDRRMTELGLKSTMMLQVHDELNFNVPKDELDTMKNIVKEEMEGAFKLSVPLRVDIGVGDNWLEAH